MPLRGLELGLAKSGRTERNTMDPRVPLQHRLEVLGGDQIGKFDEFYVVPLVEEHPCPRRQSLGDEIFFLLVAISAPCGFLVRRQRTAPVTSFSKCILLRSTANRSGPPSCAPALGLTRPQRLTALQREIDQGLHPHRLGDVEHRVERLDAGLGMRPRLQ